MSIPACGRWLIVGLATTALMVSACASGAPEASNASPPVGTSSEVASLPPPVSIEQFCGGARVPSGVTQRQLEAPDEVMLNTAWLGSGSTVAVLLHQGDGNGLCGFLFYADFLAKRGTRVALLDLCNYGQSYCINRPIADDPAAQVKLVADAARAEGAKRVALVGASMGGAFAVTAASAARADAIVDLSGPAVEFPNSDIAADAKNVTMPALFAYSKADQADLAAVQAQLRTMPTKKKVFLTYDTGHGYVLLQDLVSGEFTPLATRVDKWVKSAS